jgi:single-strand DNA-binding protein
MNKFIGTGNLTKNPEKIETANATMCKFTLACDSGYVKDGERETDFITFIAWRKTAENCLKYLKKGSKVAVVGVVKNRNYDAPDGSKKYITEVRTEEVEFLSSPKEKDESKKVIKPTSIDDDNLPF